MDIVVLLAVRVGIVSESAGPQVCRKKKVPTWYIFSNTEGPPFFPPVFCEATRAHTINSTQGQHKYRTLLPHVEPHERQLQVHQCRDPAIRAARRRSMHQVEVWPDDGSNTKRQNNIQVCNPEQLYLAIRELKVELYGVDVRVSKSSPHKWFNIARATMQKRRPTPALIFEHRKSKVVFTLEQAKPQLHKVPNRSSDVPHRRGVVLHHLRWAEGSYVPRRGQGAIYQGATQEQYIPAR